MNIEQKYMNRRSDNNVCFTLITTPDVFPIFGNIFHYYAVYYIFVAMYIASSDGKWGSSYSTP